MMPQRTLGKSTLKVSAIGLGCMGMSEFYGQTDEQESINTIHKAYALGITFFDTADMYGSGHNEKLLGEATRNFRNKIIIATKCGIVRDPTNSNARGINCQPDYIVSACEASLQRLSVDYIDLFYLHRMDPDTPIEVSMEALAKLVAAGKIRHIGLSEAPSDIIQRAHAIHPLTAIQTEYSLWSRSPERGVLKTCRELGIGFVPYSPLGRGFLTGNITDKNALAADDFRKSLPRFQEENLASNLHIVEEITQMAQEKNCTPAQLALAWVLAQGQDIVPIPGTRRVKYLEENSAAVNLALSMDDLNRMDKIAPLGATAGGRYSHAAMESYGLKD